MRDLRRGYILRLRVLENFAARFSALVKTSRRKIKNVFVKYTRLENHALATNAERRLVLIRSHPSDNNNNDDNNDGYARAALLRTFIELVIFNFQQFFLLFFLVLIFTPIPGDIEITNRC